MRKFMLVTLLLFSVPPVVLAQGQLVDGVGRTVRASESDGRVAYFSPQRVFAASVDGEAAQVRLSTLELEKTREVDARARDLEARRQAFQQRERGLSGAARLAAQADLERSEVGFRRFVEDAQAELLEVQQRVERAFLARLRPALARVVQEKGLLLVLNEDADSLVWADPRIDITPDIVKVLAATAD